MKHYEKPEVEIIALTTEDIIITSGGDALTPEVPVIPGTNNTTDIFPTY